MKSVRFANIGFICTLISCLGIMGCNQGSIKSGGKSGQPVSGIEQEKEEMQIDAITFGIYCGECSQHCATMYQYKMTGNQNSFLADYTDSYFKNYGYITFATAHNDSSHFRIADEIVDHIPDTLLTGAEDSEKFGCPDCTDGCGIYFEITRDGDKKKLYIDKQSSQLTGKVKVFAEFLVDRIYQIKQLPH